MICHRYAGYMQKDALCNHLNDSGQLWIDVWRCVNRAEVLDSLISRNRKVKLASYSDKTRMKITKGIAVHRTKVELNFD